jgi:hypothetical protein
VDVGEKEIVELVLRRPDAGWFGFEGSVLDRKACGTDGAIQDQ